MFDIKSQLKKLPELPGVYIYKNEYEEIVYVGKSKNLKKRVSSYFLKSKSLDNKTRKLVSIIREFEYIITNSEVDALILEATLIKKHKPRYNIRLKDNKSYPYIKICYGEKYPRIVLSRNYNKNDKGKFFGPFSSAQAVRNTLDTIFEIFPLRTCSRNLELDVRRPCLNYHIKKCAAPCGNYISEEDYNKLLSQAQLFLDGNHKELTKYLTEKMQEASTNMKYEEAIKYRDRLRSINIVNDKNQLFTVKKEDADYISLHADDSQACVMVFFIREGKIIGRESEMIQGYSNQDKSLLLSKFIQLHYTSMGKSPSLIYVNEEVDDRDLLELWLSKINDKKTKIATVKRGDRLKLVKLVEENAKEVLEKFEEKRKGDEIYFNKCQEEIKELISEDLKINKLEAYDISNIQGSFIVGSKVLFKDSKPLKSGYRRYKINAVQFQDDYSCMQEMLYRRLKSGLEEIKNLEEKGLETDNILPDILLIDGGVGHVNAVKKITYALGIDIPIIGMIKNKYHKTDKLLYQDITYEFSNKRNLFKLMNTIQDEVHRFAHSYHVTLRDNKMIQSTLDNIEGIGEARKKNLLIHFGSIEKIKIASVEELMQVPSINRNVAKNIYKFFRVNKNENVKK